MFTLKQVGKIKLDSQVNVDLRISKIIKLHKSSRSSRFSRSWIWSVVSKSSDHHFELINGLVRINSMKNTCFVELKWCYNEIGDDLMLLTIKWWQINDDCTRVVTQHLQTVTIKREESVTWWPSPTSQFTTRVVNNFLLRI